MVLHDPEHVAGFQNVAPIVKTSVLGSAGGSFAERVNAVSAKLTLPAIVAMNKAVTVDTQSPASVAKTFLQAKRPAVAAPPTSARESARARAG
jgi:osmoprotectant transport system substrate-binding protein